MTLDFDLLEQLLENLFSAGYSYAVFTESNDHYKAEEIHDKARESIQSILTMVMEDM
jgi:hypothetical protein